MSLERSCKNQALGAEMKQERKRGRATKETEELSEAQ